VSLSSATAAFARRYRGVIKFSDTARRAVE
jgi:hypothetical protein